MRGAETDARIKARRGGIVYPLPKLNAQNMLKIVEYAFLILTY